MNYAAVGAEPGWDTVEWLYACTGPQFALLDDDDNLADGMRVRFVTLVYVSFDTSVCLF